MYKYSQRILTLVAEHTGLQSNEQHPSNGHTNLPQEILTKLSKFKTWPLRFWITYTYGKLYGNHDPLFWTFLGRHLDMFLVSYLQQMVNNLWAWHRVQLQDSKYLPPSLSGYNREFRVLKIDFKSTVRALFLTFI